MKTLIALILFNLYFFDLHSQTYRDSLVKQINYNLPKNEMTYQKLKVDIKKLEEIEGKPNPEILHSHLKNIYKFNDIEYFKEVLTLLTRKYGYNLSYASGEEMYYNDIINGALKNWFKEMYIKNHSEWLSENLDKQVDIFKLNSLYSKDQTQRSFSSMIRNVNDLTDNQLKQIRTLEGIIFNNNFETLIALCKKADNLPKGNSFALIQNDYNIVELHILQHEDTFEKAWKSLYPFYKKAYLNKDISSKYFRTIDATLYMQEGKQIFDLIKTEDIPENTKRNSNNLEISVRNKKETKKIRTELGWE